MSIAPSEKGLMLTIEETSDPNNLGGTNSGFIPYSDLCNDPDCILDAYQLSKPATLSTTSYGDVMWTGGGAGELVYTDLSSGSVTVSSTGGSLLGDITAVNTNDGGIAWFGTLLGEVGYANDSDFDIVATFPEPSVAVTSVAMLGVKIALIGTASGNVWITTDCGDTWNKACTKCGLAVLTSIDFICMADCRTGYIIGKDASGKVQVFWTNDAFCSCKQLTNKSGGNKLVTNLKIDEVTACAVCPESGQLVIGGIYRGTPTVISG